MKRNQAILIYQAILGIKLDKMSETMTDAILSNALATAEVNDAFNKAQEELRKRTIETVDKERLSKYDDRQSEINNLNENERRAAMIIFNNEFKDVVKHIERYNKAIIAWLDKDVDIDLQLVDRKEFVQACKDSDQTVTLAALQRLSLMFKPESVVKYEIDEAEIDALLEE